MRVKKLLFRAFELIAIGIFATCAGVGLARSNSEETSIVVNLERQDYIVKNTDVVNTIDVSLIYEDVRIEMADIDSIVVRYADSQEEPIFEITEESDKLVISRAQSSVEGIDKLHILDVAESIAKADKVINGRESFAIYVPTGYRGKYNINTISGGVHIENLEGSEEIDIDTTSGNMHLDRVFCDGAITVSTVSGNITGEKVSANDCRFDATSGDIDVSDVLINNTFLCDTTSGDVDIILSDALDMYSVNTDTISGRIKCEKGLDKTAAKTIEISTTSGDVDITSKR